VKSKVYDNAEAALFDVADGMSLMSGGFGLCGIPENSIKEIQRRGIKNIHAISNNIGNSGRGLAWLLKEKQISQATCSYVGGNPDLEQQMLAKEVDVTLVPQGTFSERILFWSFRCTRTSRSSKRRKATRLGTCGSRKRLGTFRR